MRRVALADQTVWKRLLDEHPQIFRYFPCGMHAETQVRDTCVYRYVYVYVCIYVYPASWLVYHGTYTADLTHLL